MHLSLAELHQLCPETHKWLSGLKYTYYTFLYMNLMMQWKVYNNNNKLIYQNGLGRIFEQSIMLHKIDNALTKLKCHDKSTLSC